MASRIDPRLLERLKKELSLGRSAVYARIQRHATTQRLPIDLAAIDFASENGINPTRYATREQLAALRPTGRPQIPSGPVEINTTRAPLERRVRASQGKSRKKTKGNRVFVVHGRDERLRKAMFQFLRAAGVQPIEWAKALSYSKSASPHIGDILEAAFAKAQAVVVMLTPDDEARLKQEFVRRGEPRYESKLMGQARPNVLFEAGMAFGTHSRQTVLVEFGKLRPISDVVGRHAVRMDNSTERRQELMIKLQNAGCNVDFTGSDWQTEGDFRLRPLKPT